MEKIMSALTKRLGPLPVWVWATVAAVAILGYAYWQQRNKQRYAVAPVASLDDAPADAGDIDGIDDDDDDDDENEIEFTSNAAWARYVVDKLTIRGEDPVLVTNALNKVLYGQEVTQQEAAIYNEAVRLYGAPPEPVPIIKIKPPPGPGPGPGPTPTPIPTHESVPGPSLDIYTWVDQLNQRYPGLDLSFTKMVDVLNPGARKYIKWLPGPPSANYKIPVFDPNWSKRNPPLGIPPMRIRW